MNTLSAALFLVCSLQGTDPKTPPKTLEAWVKSVDPELRVDLEKKVVQIFKEAGTKSSMELAESLERVANVMREDWTPVFLTSLRPRQGKEATALLQAITAKMLLGTYRNPASARPLNALLIGEILPRATTGDPEGKVAALEALGIIGQEQVAVSDPGKGAALEGLQRSEEAARAIKAACEKAQKDSDERVRQAATETLEKIAPPK